MKGCFKKYFLTLSSSIFDAALKKFLICDNALIMSKKINELDSNILDRFN